MVVKAKGLLVLCMCRVFMKWNTELEQLLNQIWSL